jgi:HK97 family phage portal protein
VILDRLFPRLTPAPSDDYWYMSTGRQVASGVRVDENAAWNYSGVWSATRIISETEAMLPLPLYRRRPTLGKDVACQHPVFRLIHDAPNDEMDAMCWRDTMTAYALNWGNGVSEIQRNRGGQPIALWPIHPSRVKFKRNKRKIVEYWIANADQTHTVLTAEDVFHLTGVLAEDGIVGKGVITYARESIGLGIATERFGAAFFGNGAIPGGVLTHPGRLSEKAAKNLRESWNTIHSGPSNAARMGILEEGTKYEKIGIPPEDAQFLETRKFNITEIARWYRIPAHMLAELEGANYNSLEQMGAEFVTYCLMPWLRRWELTIGRKLLTREEQTWYFAQHHTRSLLRGDTVARANAHQIEFMNGAITIDEWRDDENRNPLPDELGDRHYVQANLTPVQAPAPEPAEPPAAAPATSDAGETDADRAASPENLSDGDLLELPDIRQEDNYSCGAAVAMSVGKYFGVGPDTLEEWKAALDTTPENSTRPWKIVQYLAELGLRVTAAAGLTVDDLRDFWKKGMPVICPIQEYGIPSKQASFDYGHYVASIGVWGSKSRYVMVQDPSVDNVLEGQDADQAPGRMPIHEDKWLEIWHDEDADQEQYVQFGIAVGPGAKQEEQKTEDSQPPTPPSLPPPATPAAEPKARGDAEPPALPAGGTLSERPYIPGQHYANAMIRDALARMLKKEANEARRAAKKPATFLNWLDRFYAKHEDLVCQAVMVPAQLLIGQERAALAIARRHVAQSRDELLNAADGPPGQFLERVEAAVSAWPERAAQFEVNP